MADSCKLVQFLKGDLFDKTWKAQREELLEKKWERNLAAFKRTAEGKTDVVPWAKSENHKPWQSLTVSDLTKTKAVAGKVAVCDIMLRGGRVQYLLQREDFGEDLEPGAEAVQQDQEQAAALDEASPTRIIERHKALIDRQLEWCDAEGEMGTGVLYGAIFGETWVHVAVGEHEESAMEEVAPGIFERVSNTIPAPVVEHVSPWEMFWDVEKGPRDGEGLCRVQYMSPGEVRMLKKRPLYIAKAIDELLETHKAKADTTGTESAADTSDPVKRRRNNTRRRNMWVGEFQVTITQAQALEAEKWLDEKYGSKEYGRELYPDVEPGDGETDDDHLVEVHVVIACDCIIRYTRVGSKRERSYFRALWEIDPEGHGGISVADNVEFETLTLTKLTRALEDCSRLISRIVMAGKRRLLDGDLRVEVGDPDSFIDLSDEVTDVRQAIQQLEVRAPIGDLLRALEFYLGLGDVASNIPRAQQGQEAGNPQTWSELRERLNRAGMYMGDIFRHYDELIEDVIEWFVEFNMGDPTLQIGKVPMKVRAMGFASYMDRVVKLQAIYDLLDRILSNETLQQLCKVQPLVSEAAKASDIEPTLFIKTDAELQEAADREAALLAQQQGGQKPASGAEVQAQMAKVEALFAEVEKKKAETEKIKEEITAKRADTTMKAMQTGAPEPAPAPAPVVPSAEPAMQPAEGAMIP